jgi:hypothetical protein
MPTVVRDLDILIICARGDHNEYLTCIEWSSRRCDSDRSRAGDMKEYLGGQEKVLYPCSCPIKKDLALEDSVAPDPVHGFTGLRDNETRPDSSTNESLWF